MSKPQCRFYNTRTGCRYGDKCRFAHSDRPGRLVPPDPLTDWKRHLGHPGSNPRPINYADFFHKAASLVQGSHSQMQEVIQCIASDNGLIRIKEMLDRLVPVRPAHAERFLTQEILPLLKAVTHDRVRSSPLLEKPLVDIYNYLYGPVGRRAERLFELFMPILDPERINLDHCRNFHAIFIAVDQIVELNGSANINPTLVSSVEKFLEHAIVILALDECEEKGELFRMCDRLNRLLNMGKSIEPTWHSVEKRVPTKASFRIHQDPPGTRHDNDHVSIRDIQILPTYGEINSQATEYLPTQQDDDRSDELESLIDRQFRLLREDTIGQLRDAIRYALAASTGKDIKPRSDGPRIHAYHGIQLIDVVFLRGSGLEFFIEINQPAQHSDLKRRRDWWDRSKSLQKDALICLANLGPAHVFCTVTAQGRPTAQSSGAHKSPEFPSQATRLQRYDDRTIHSDSRFAFLSLRPVDVAASEIDRLLDPVNWSQQTVLIEFPGIVLPAFQPTLRALQAMSRSRDMPFSHILATNSSQVPTLPCPAYASSANFAFDLDPILTTHETLEFSPHRGFELSELTARSSIDDSQAEALLHCLRSSIALIQGPPGTGKSFTGIALIKVLLAAKQKANLGPIICVCFTNHALDQLLEHLHNQGVQQIVRVGSRSKSEILQNVNLRTIARETEQTAAEKRTKWSIHKKMDEHSFEASRMLDQHHKIHYARNIESYLLKHNLRHARELFNVNDVDEGWQEVRSKKDDPVQRWIREGRVPEINEVPRHIEELELAFLVTMSRPERQKLFDSWIAGIRDDIVRLVTQSSVSYREQEEQYNVVRGEIDLRCLQAADVVGFTTSGLARNLDIMRKLRSKVMVCEEAGEVLEAHLLTALLPSLEHVILIGDHLQLRPQVQNYELSRENPRGAKYSLDVSLFERLVQDTINQQPGIPYRTLETQRRMHPSISALVRDTLYPTLKDSSSVLDYPPITGMRDRLFWLDHDQPEDRAQDSMGRADSSHSNSFEVEMVSSLVSHIIRQGVYSVSDIAVLTPYLGQFFKLRAALGKVMEVSISDRDVEDAERKGYQFDTSPPQTVHKTSLLQAIRLSTVDNFQGEEAKLVIVSLVRSNEQRRVGFLKTSNRINVLLSRAQHGMYIVGNATTAGSVEMWSDVICMLRENDNLGNALRLQCPRHPDTSLPVSEPDDFVTISPEGGCGLLCERRLGCGHPCRHQCHSPMLHDRVECLEACTRSLSGCDHSCPNPCGSKCVDRCAVVITNGCTTLPCDHTIYDPRCWQLQHPGEVMCMVVVERVVPGCNHVVRVPCHVNVDSSSFKCTAICSTNLSCGHNCSRACYRCLPASERIIGNQASHGQCMKVCGRSYNNCSHECAGCCHAGSDCEPCSKPCAVVCEHSTCNKVCNEPCAPCAKETCHVGCAHTQCTLPCAAPCDWLPCNERCNKQLECGHQCPSLCGETCPSEEYCQPCADERIKGLQVDMLEMKTYEEVDLDECPCLFPPCGHIQTVETMDGIMGMSKHYEFDMMGKATTIVGNSIDLTASMPTCATCRAPLHTMTRYGRILRQAMIAETTKKFVTWSHAQYIPLAQKVQELHEDLSSSGPVGANDFSLLTPMKLDLTGTKERQIRTIFNIPGVTRYRKLNMVYVRLQKHFISVRTTEQPFGRVWDLVQHKRRTRGIEASGLAVDEGVLQPRQQLLATSLLHRCGLAVLADFLKQATLKADSDISFDVNREESDALSSLANPANQYGVEVEAKMYFGRYCAAEQTILKKQAEQLITEGGSATVIDTIRTRIKSLQEQGLSRVQEARVICQRYPGSTRYVVQEIEEVEKMISESSLSDVLLPQEMKAVYEAMSREFSGTGHWYYCANGHPFTVGECGMPMQTSRCPECGAVVGGQNHQAASGVNAATDLEARMRDMTL